MAQNGLAVCSVYFPFRILSFINHNARLRAKTKDPCQKSASNMGINYCMLGIAGILKYIL